MTYDVCIARVNGMLLSSLFYCNLPTSHCIPDYHEGKIMVLEFIAVRRAKYKRFDVIIQNYIYKNTQLVQTFFTTQTLPVLLQLLPKSEKICDLSRVYHHCLGCYTQ